MKLQVNQRGSWRNVVEFGDDKATFMKVAEAVLPLVNELGKSANWRIVENDGLSVVAYCGAPTFKWERR